MNDPYVIYYLFLSAAVVVVVIYLAYKSYRLGRHATGITQKFLYSLAGVRLSIAAVELFWLGLVFLPLLLPPEWLAWTYYRLTATLFWTASQLAVAGATYYAWRTLHRKG